MDLTAKRFALPSLRTTLLLDTAFELLGGALLLLPESPVARWLGMSPRAALVLGIAFVAAGAVLAMLHVPARPNAAVVRGVALANIAGGVALWLFLLAAWPRFGPEARTVLGAAGDAFLALGVLELLALRRPGASAR